MIAKLIVSIVIVGGFLAYIAWISIASIPKQWKNENKGRQQKSN